MSNLQNYVRGNSPTPPNPHQRPTPFQDRLALTKNLKIPRGNTSNSTNTVPKLASTAPPLGYSSNEHSNRNTFPNSQYQQNSREILSHFDNTSIGSEFENTKSDIQSALREPAYKGDEEDYGGDEDDEGYLPDHRSQYETPQQNIQRDDSHNKQIQSQMPKFNTEEISRRVLPSISGRFQTSGHPSEFQIRPGHNDSQQNNGYKKRGRSNDPGWVNKSQLIHGQHSFSGRRLSENGELPGPDDYMSGDHGRGNKSPRRLIENSVHSDAAETITSVDSQSRHFKYRSQPQNSQPQTSAIAPNYTDKALQGMKYNDLKSESWGTIPHDAQFNLPEHLIGPSVTVGDKISYYVKNHDNFEDAAFYIQLTATEFDEAGDYFIERFTDLLKKMKQKKREKRKMVEDFEAEIEAREKVVRDKFENFDVKLMDMRTNGEVMLRGKF